MSSADFPSSRFGYRPAAGVMAMVGLIAGAAYSQAQLSPFSALARQNYPLLLQIFPASVVAGLIMASFLLSRLLLGRIVCTRQPGTLILAIGLAHLPLLGIPAGVPAAACLGLVALSHIGIILAATTRQRLLDRLQRLLPHVLALLVISLAHLMLAGMVSPLNQEAPLTVYRGVRPQGDSAVLSPLYKNFIWSKQFSYSDLDYSDWASAPHVPLNFRSLPLPSLALLLDLPSVDIKTFHRLVNLLVFGLFVAGAFGCYLFLHIGLGVRFGVALMGGLAFILGNTYYHTAFMWDYLSFVSAYSLLPYALLGLNHALHRGHSMGAAWAGAALAAPFYLLAPHPEAVMHLGLAVGCMVFAHLLICGGHADLKKRLGSVVICGALFLLLSAAHLLPVFGSVWSGEMAVFGHRSDVFHDRPPLALYTSFGSILLPMVLLGTFEILRQWRNRYPVPEFWGFGLMVVVVLGIVVPGNAGPAASLLTTLDLPVYFLREFRILMYFYLAAMVVIAMGADALLEGLERWASRIQHHPNAMAGRILRAGANGGAFLILAVALGSSIDPSSLSNGHGVGNPHGCSYYVSLSAVLANMPGLEPDRANLSHLKQRLIEFENDLQESRNFRVEQTRRLYQQQLSELGVSSASRLSEDQVRPTAQRLFALIDDFYLGPGGCIYPPMIAGDSLPSKRVLRYNNDSLYAHLPDRFMRILGATGRNGRSGWTPRAIDSHLGIGSGLFVNNATTSVDSRFLMGYPLLHALYLVPGYHFEDRGTYHDRVQWKLEAGETLNPSARKILNLGGIDVMTIRQEEWDILSNKVDLEPIPGRFHPRIDPRYVTLHDRRSYGMAYLATDIVEVDARLVGSAENTIRDYFADRVKLPVYRSVVDRLRQRLLALPGSHGIVLEDGQGSLAAAPRTASNNSPGTVTIEAIVGPRAAFRVDCRRPSCLMVFNNAALSGWKAFVDGTASTVHRANFAFLAVDVPRGLHSVLFVYRPWWEVAGTVTTLGSLLTLFGVGILSSGRPNKN